jgi:molybdenum cofactor cytidylyltransferase
VPHPSDHAVTSRDAPPGTTLAVVLAAGGGTRFDGPTHKLLSRLADGRTIADHAIGEAVQAAIGPVLVVLGAVEFDLPAGVARVVNRDWADGQAGSLQCARAEAERMGAEAMVVGLADQPFVPPEAWRNVAASTAPIAVATYHGARRNPVRLHRSVWALLPTGGDHGARDLIRLRPELVEPVPCPGSASDIDTLADLRNIEEQRPWQNSSSTNSP